MTERHPPIKRLCLSFIPKTSLPEQVEEENKGGKSANPDSPGK